ncbi:nuclear transport factor 2 family protein [Flagellimonas sp. HMM57]|uniref:nuclear transport factor 2 family protein n=1 Tax=unclassified Flagellimonas TaxID=2644544 RepID=UPI0013D8C2CC|nr:MULTISPECIES: nuclear transport factor 2 family protein [unclassified Flagellimonas]UII77720.1 nuclear transport factor 2 family protein [Flagellimonas sp. HMM57]
MTTQEVADKLVSFCREGKYDEAYGLYAEDALSVEMPGMPNEITIGRENIINQYREWAAGIEEMHGGTVGDPVVAGNHFVVPMSMDATFKETGRMQMDELCMYQVENGAIKKASYHYEVPSMS